MTEDDFTNSTVFKAIIIAILVLTLFCTLASLCQISDMRKMEDMLDTHSAQLLSIGATVRDPFVVEQEIGRQASHLRMFGCDASRGAVIEHLRTHDPHYANGEMTLPNWITG